jgi:hypothetical protein
MKLIALALLLTACSTLPDKNIINQDVIKMAQDTIVPAISNQHTLLYSYAGVGLFILGALTSAFWDKKSGLILILCGTASGAVPYVVTSSYFAWISAGSLLAVAAIGIWYLRWKAMHEAKEEEEADA